MDIHEALRPPLDIGTVEKLVPELKLARGLEGSPFHHLDTFEHTLEVVRGIERELEEGEVGARIDPGRIEALRLAGILHDVAKSVTRGEVDGRVLFVAHDTLGARMIPGICRRLDLSAGLTDAAVILTTLHLKIGFMGNPRADYPPARLAAAAGPFGEELAVLSWADRLAAQGPRLKDEHIERHRTLCIEFLQTSRKLGPYPEPEYGELARKLGLSPETDGADIGYAASRVRLLESRGLGESDAVEHVMRLTRRAEG